MFKANNMIEIGIADLQAGFVGNRISKTRSAANNVNQYETWTPPKKASPVGVMIFSPHKKVFGG